MLTNTIYNQAYYYQGQQVEVEHIFTNQGKVTIQFELFPPEIAVGQAFTTAGILPIRIFPAGTQSKHIPPGEVLKHKITWDQLDENGKQVPLGYYNSFIKNFHIKPPMEIIDGMSAGALRIGSEGMMLDDVIELNQQITKDGLTFTLEKLVFAPFGTTIQMFCCPSNYKSGAVTNISIENKVDYRKLSNNISLDFEWSNNGMRILWSKVEPIDKDSKVYSLTIHGFNHNNEKWEGPWEFNIPLQ